MAKEDHRSHFAPQDLSGGRSGPVAPIRAFHLKLGRVSLEGCDVAC